MNLKNLLAPADLLVRRADHADRAPAVRAAGREEGVWRRSSHSGAPATTVQATASPSGVLHDAFRPPRPSVFEGRLDVLIPLIRRVDQLIAPRSKDHFRRASGLKGLVDPGHGPSRVLGNHPVVVGARFAEPADLLGDQVAFHVARFDRGVFGERHARAGIGRAVARPVLEEVGGRRVVGDDVGVQASAVGMRGATKAVIASGPIASVVKVVWSLCSPAAFEALSVTVYSVFGKSPSASAWTA